MRHRLFASSAALLLAGGIVAGPSSALARPPAGSAWTVDPISMTTYDTTLLTGVDCSDSAADGTCLAVGSVTDNDQSQHVVIERRTGAGWVDVPAAEPSRSSDAVLASISCSSAARCFAVGRAAYGRTVKPLIEQSDKTGWRLDSGAKLPAATVSELSGISCVSKTFCVAVGDTGTRTARSALVETWDGTAWHRVDAPNASLPSTQLLGVACTSPVFCAAVGAAGPSAANSTSMVEELWNGSTWSLRTAGRGDTAELTAVDCTSATFCLAVGDMTSDRGGHVTARRWDGTSWTAVDVPSPAGLDARLTGIACVSPTYCMAVGANNRNPGVSTFARLWTGTAFVKAAQPFIFLPVLAVACFSSGGCAAVGYGNDIYNGSQWTLESSRSHSGAPRSTRLTAVSCAASTNCVAVGEQYDVGIEGYPLALHSTGASWRTDRDGPAAEISSVNAVSCGGAPAISCLSSGYYQPQAKAKTLVQRFDGSEWQVEQGVPHIGASNAISCVPSFCVVTGAGALALFDGDSWTSVPIVGPGGAQTQLNGAECLSADDCIVVGGYAGDDPNVELPLVERWDGSRWSVVAAPPGPSGRSNVLQAVTCSSPSACVAVGTSHGSSDSSLLLIWDGAAWTSVAHPGTGGGLDAVACASPASCVAVGPEGGVLASADGTWGRSHIAVPPGDTGALPTLTGITYAGSTYHVVGSYDRLGDQTALAESLAA